MRSELIKNAAYANYDLLTSYLPSKERTKKACTTALIATLSLQALGNMPTANAGPISYATCVASCAASPMIPMCVPLCAALLGPWCP